MLKSAKYFFLIFIFTTIIPLLLMFFWINQRIEKMETVHALHFSHIGKKEFKSVLDGYLQRQEGKALSGLGEFDSKQNNLKELQKKNRCRFFTNYKK